MSIVVRENLPFSGLGDRIGFYLGLSTLGKILDKKIITAWNVRMDHIGDNSLELFNILRFPDNIIFEKMEILESYKNDGETFIMPNLSTFDFKEQFIKYHGVDQVPELQWKMFKLMGFNVGSKEDYMNVYQQQGKLIKFDYPKYVNKILNHEVVQGNKYLMIHARRGDKDTNRMLIDSVTIDKLNYICDYLNSHDLLNKIKFIICSDCEKTYEMFQSCLKQKNADIIVIPKSKTPLNNVIIDYELMKNSIGIVQSVGDFVGYYAGWSSFSSVPSFIYDIPVYGTYPTDYLGDYRYNLYQKLNDDINIKNYYFSDMLDSFLRRLF
jgi:hypothetical protein